MESVWAIRVNAAIIRVKSEVVFLNIVIYSKLLRQVMCQRVIS